MPASLFSKIVDVCLKGGCSRTGQSAVIFDETIARLINLKRPPRRMKSLVMRRNAVATISLDMPGSQEVASEPLPVWKIFSKLLVTFLAAVSSIAFLGVAVVGKTGCAGVAGARRI